MSEMFLIYIISALQIILAFGLINVWILRFHKKTPYRGKGAHDMKSEFAAYGLPVWFMYIIGFLKLATAGAFIAGLWYPFLVPYAAFVLIGLMAGAVSMHLKVGDNFKQTAPSLAMLVMAVVIALLV